MWLLCLMCTCFSLDHTWNNTIKNTQHYGIRVEDQGSQGGNITANIHNNTFSNVGRAGIWQTGDKARVYTSGNSGG